MSLAQFLDHQGRDSLRIDRNSLKTQLTDLLRGQIIGGRLPQGTRLVEQELADLLGISRMPARDALINLEHEGLVVSKPNGRYVIELDQSDIEQLFQVRLVLERLAVAQAAQQRSPTADAALQANLQRMREAIARNDQDAYAQSDLEAHQMIWLQANNPYLLKMLNSIIGPIFMFIASHTEFQMNWHETLQLHEELADLLIAGDSKQAMVSIEVQLQQSLQLSLRVFEQVHPLNRQRQ
ncbi:MAG: GntR family transcriptional regulator [Caldilineaceae bacterium]